MNFTRALANPEESPGLVGAPREEGRLALDLLQAGQDVIPQQCAKRAVRGVETLQALRVDLYRLAHVAKGAVALVNLRRVPEGRVVRLRGGSELGPDRTAFGGGERRRVEQPLESDWRCASGGLLGQSCTALQQRHQ